MMGTANPLPGCLRQAVHDATGEVIKALRRLRCGGQGVVAITNAVQQRLCGSG
jgi:hypothetical protein